MRRGRGLAGRIVSDTFNQPGALPLLAYTLDELYQLCGAGGILTHAAYEKLGGSCPGRAVAGQIQLPAC